MTTATISDLGLNYEQVDAKFSHSPVQPLPKRFASGTTSRAKMTVVEDEAEDVSAFLQQPSSLSGTWVVAHVRGQYERKISTSLVMQGVGVFLPMVKVPRVGEKIRKGSTRWSLLFPHYVFVCCRDGESDAAKLLGCDGIHRTINVPTICQRSFRAELDAVALAISSGLYLENYREIVIGKEVRVTSGPMLGTRGILIRRGKSQFVIQVETLGQAIAVEIDPDKLEPWN